jgi:hypothetical protein
VQVGTAPLNNSTYGLLATGSLSSPSPALCSAVSNEHGSTPSNRTSRGRGGSSTPLGADGVPSTTVVHPVISAAATASITSRTSRS